MYDLLVYAVGRVRDIHRVPQIGAEVKVEYGGLALPVVVSVQERRSDQVFGPFGDRNFVAVSVPFGEAPERPILLLNVSIIL